MIICPICKEPTIVSELLTETIFNDCAVIITQYTCAHCHKKFIGTQTGEINFWHPEEIEECK